jgi:hypothetical protein
MKEKHLNLRLLTLFFVSNFLMLSCEESDTIQHTEQLTVEETLAFMEADDISDEVNNIIDSYFAFEEGFTSKESGENKYNPLDCLTKTTEISGNNKTVILDFGEGCTLPNGNILSGKIILNYAKDIDVHSLSVTYTFEDFNFNDRSIEGENAMVRIRENEHGNPQSTLHFNVKVTWIDGEITTRVGTKVREWVEGFNTRTLGDNVFLMTGNWTVTHMDSTTSSANIIEPLRREMACRFVVRGIIELVKNEKNGTLNFGDGTCDNKAVFTNEGGEEKEIILR